MAETLKLVHLPYEQYVIETSVKQRVSEQKIALAVLAHLRGEWDIGEFDRAFHMLDFRQKLLIRSEHSVCNGSRLLIVTEFDRSRTAIKLIDEA